MNTSSISRTEHPVAASRKSSPSRIRMIGLGFGSVPGLVAWVWVWIVEVMIVFACARGSIISGVWGGVVRPGPGPVRKSIMVREV